MESRDPSFVWIYPFLEMVSERPGAYVGSEDVFILESFIHGYVQARLDLGFSKFGKTEENIFDDFSVWIRARVNDPKLAYSPWSHIVHFLAKDGRSAVLFFSLLSEFLESKGTSLSELSRQVEID